MFSLEIKVEGFVITTSDGGRTYNEGKVIKWMSREKSQQKESKM